ncbi:MAG: hypothetical protein SNJ82_09830 [Gemmataceae bacterium]
MILQSFRILILFALGIVSLSCGHRPASATIEGEVVVDGTPLTKGFIAFVPADSLGEPVTTSIENGRYRIVTTAGRKFVQISAPVVVNRRKDSDAPDAAWIEVTQETIPPRYNAQTELTFDAQAVSIKKDWHLSVKKR